MYNLFVVLCQGENHKQRVIKTLTKTHADPSGRAIEDVVLRPLACWDCGFEYRRQHGCLPLVNVVCARLVR